MPMINEFNSMASEAFLSQPNGPNIPTNNPNQSERSGSPEFMSSGNFSESSSINEGLVW